MSNIDKHAVQAVADLKAGYTLGHADVAILNELARIALASLEAEPVAWLLSGGGAKNNVSFDSGNAYADPLREVTPLYTATPAPVSVPDEVCWEDVPEEITEDDMALASAWAHGFNQCRAAMLKHSEPFIVTSDHRMMEMPQVEAINAVTAMLHGADGNSPVIPDGWVACSERMPEQFKAILAFNEYGEVWSGAYDRYWNFYCDNLLVEHVTHWMPLPAAPQQEVK
ncbi:DUF551 domain-containing protein [Enterobacter kobei]|uniref:DUF551 domain-containing protein n=1 Tax=Enterobacter kobei TaxID=208224 RepID=UPI0022383170|nr:DUF551 domain-containing protein [Enterobacter kobei]MCW4701703.1 DUF551 domain-containing protein [Enterobacter kobei]